MNASIYIQNLKCGGCAHTITKNLQELPDLNALNIDVEANKISFDYSVEDTLKLVKAKLISLGYPSIEDENSFLHKAKSFVSCASGKLSK